MEVGDRAAGLGLLAAAAAVVVTSSAEVAVPLALVYACALPGWVVVATDAVVSTAFFFSPASVWSRVVAVTGGRDDPEHEEGGPQPQLPGVGGSNVSSWVPPFWWAGNPLYIRR